LGSLTVLSPQPDDDHAGGIQYASITRSGDGTINKQGPFFPFTWSELTAAQYAAILALFGVGSADNANVTIYVRDVDLTTWVRKNGVAQRPFPGEDVSWYKRPKDLTILVTDLEAAS
jgi:hypothetical protein